MENNNHRSGAVPIAFLVGAVVGGVAALLLAPACVSGFPARAAASEARVTARLEPGTFGVDDVAVLTKGFRKAPPEMEFTETVEATPPVHGG